MAFDSIEAYAAPRRLALKIVDVDAAQPDTQKRFDGPALQAAYDAEGQPTCSLKALCAVKASQLTKSPHLKSR